MTPAVRELEAQVERRKLLVAELPPARRMLQDVAKKSGDRRPAARRGRAPHGDLPGLTTPGWTGAGPAALDAALAPA
jgi:hypothetical protein